MQLLAGAIATLALGGCGEEPISVPDGADGAGGSAGRAGTGGSGGSVVRPRPEHELPAGGVYAGNVRLSYSRFGLAVALQRAGQRATILLQLDDGAPVAVEGPIENGSLLLPPIDIESGSGLNCGHHSARLGNVSIEAGDSGLLLLANAEVYFQIGDGIAFDQVALALELAPLAEPAPVLLANRALGPASPWPVQLLEPAEIAEAWFDTEAGRVGAQVQPPLVAGGPYLLEPARPFPWGSRPVARLAIDRHFGDRAAGAVPASVVAAPAGVPIDSSLRALDGLVLQGLRALDDARVLGHEGGLVTDDPGVPWRLVFEVNVPDSGDARVVLVGRHLNGAEPEPVRLAAHAGDRRVVRALSSVPAQTQTIDAGRYRTISEPIELTLDLSPLRGQRAIVTAESPPEVRGCDVWVSQSFLVESMAVLP